MGKNSDREPNEAQNITFVPARIHSAGSTIRCTHITIPQVRHTSAVLLSRPFWMFGAEMGVNEHGVAIGNEAVFTKEAYHKKNTALTGMDMLRLALERETSGSRARDCIIDLIEHYGQGGEQALKGTLHYHNSFLIADPEEAFVLETAGKFWVWKRVKDLESISNCLTIEEEFDEASPGISDYARSQGYLKRGKNLNFRRDFSDKIYTHFAKGEVRRRVSRELLFQKKGVITSSDMMRVLRDHNMHEPFMPGIKPMERICLHAGGVISTQTTGSMVASLKKGAVPLVYLTGTSAPCMSLFKPHAVKGDAKEMGLDMEDIKEHGEIDIYGSATGRYDNGVLWWRGEDIHRRVLMHYSALMPYLVKARGPLEESMMHDVEKNWKDGKDRQFLALCRKHSLSMSEKTKDLAELITAEYECGERKRSVPHWFRLQWWSINRQAGIRI